MSEFTIGRSPDNNFQISDPHVSRHHAKLVRNGSSLEVVDLGSSCGTYVNGHRVNHSPLRIGDDLRISQHFRFNWNSAEFNRWFSGGSSYPPSHQAASGGSVLIGRSSECSLRLSNPSVSRRHAELSRSGNGFVLTDLQSSGGTFVNGQRINRSRVKPGDRVLFAGREPLDWNHPTIASLSYSPHAQADHYSSPQPSPVYHGRVSSTPERASSNAGWIFGSAAAVFVAVAGVLFATGPIEISGDDPAPVYSPPRTSSSNSIVSTGSFSTGSSSNSARSGSSYSSGVSSHSSSSYSSSSSPSYSSSSSSQSSSSPSNLELAVDYGQAIYEGDVIELVQLEMEHGGIQRTAQATLDVCEGASEGRYGAGVQRATQAIDRAADELFSGAIGW